MNTCESLGAAQVVLEAKFLPCKEGERSEPGPKLCLFAQQRLELCWSPVGTWSPAVLPTAGARSAHVPAAPVLSYGTINATVDKNRSLLSGAEGWLVSILPSIHCSWITAKESEARSALQHRFS